MAVQVSSIALDVEELAVRLVGAVEGMATQEVAELVSALAWSDAADVPTASTASTV